MKEENKPFGFNFAAYTLQTFFAIFLTQLLSLGISVITARALGPAGRGSLTILNLYPTLLLTFCHLSIYRALTINIAEKKYPFGCFPGSVLIYVFFTTILIIPVFIITYFKFNNLFIQGLGFDLIMLSLAMFPFLLITQIFSSMLEATGRISQVNFKEVFNSGVLLIFITISLLILKKGLAGTVFSYFVTSVFTAFLAIYLVKRISVDKWQFSFPLLKTLIKDGAKLHIAVIANFISLRVNMLMLGHYQQSSSVGYYSIAVSIVELLSLISLATQSVFYSKISDMVKDKAEMAKKTVSVYKHSLWIFIIAAIFISIFSKVVIIFFYGDKFLPAYKPLLILLPGVFFLYLNNIFVNYLVGMKKFIVVSIMFSFCSFLSVFLNILFIPRYDMVGAAVSGCIVYIIQSFFILLLFLFVSKYSLKKLLAELSFKKEDFLIYITLFKKLILKS